MAKQKNFTCYIYEVRKHGKTVATSVFEQDAMDFVAKNGGEIYTIGAY